MFESIGLAHAVGKRFEQDGQEIARLEQEVKKLKWELAQQKASAAGYKAQVSALLDVHKESPLSEKTNLNYSMPEYREYFKTRLTLVYEKAFDQACRAMKVNDPTRLRID